MCGGLGATQNVPGRPCSVIVQVDRTRSTVLTRELGNEEIFLLVRATVL